MSMFCYQCEQTAKGTGCTVMGVCGKDETVAKMQDLLMHVAKGIAKFSKCSGVKSKEIDEFIVEALFTTVTNVSFDAERLKETVLKGRKLAMELKEKCGEDFTCPIGNVPFETVADMVAVADKIGIEAEKQKFGEDITGLMELILYGLKGMAAYADHAKILGQESDDVYAFFTDALATLTNEEQSVDDLLGLALKVGEVNLTVMGLLDAANTGVYGKPEPTQVRITPVKGKCILVSGHDLKDLDILLQQTEGKGINIYTHGEMLPCNAYPGLKKYKHLVGNYGGAWQDQKKEFDVFPGSILMTTNCIQKPQETYKARIFTTGLVAWPGVTHIGEDKDFTPVIEAALAAPGFEEDDEEKTITIGFGHDAVMSVAGTVIDAVKAGDIKHFFLIGGCDGAKSGRNYFTEIAQKVPQDCVILTLACGKYRFNKLEFGDIGGIPRLLDCGQCNDAYSAIQIAVALAGAFECGVNDLPLSMILSWYEQKAVCILLTLLHLGIQNIKLGPTLPAFITPAALNILVEKFNIAPTTTADEDLKEILG